MSNVKPQILNEVQDPMSNEESEISVLDLIWHLNFGLCHF